MTSASAETERRFLVKDTSVVAGAPWQLLTQAYLFVQDGYAVRVRRIQDPIPFETSLSTGHAFLTGKGPDHGFGAARERDEFETEVDPLWAQQVIGRCANVITKRRYQVLTTETWEVDEFLDENEGLWIAELEGGAEVNSVKRPEWLSTEISKDDRYDNDNLAIRPYKSWEN